MKPKFFPTQSDFRKWLEKNHDKEKELFVGFYKVGSGKPSITWSQSVDEALCFGWIDGVRKTIDEQSYTNRFTPRRKSSTWSQINIKKIGELKRSGLMKPAGLAAFENRNPEKQNLYAYEREHAKFTAEYEKKFKSNKTAWKFFNEQAPSYKRVLTFWVMSAKQEKTQLSRLDRLIKTSAEGKRVM